EALAAYARAIALESQGAAYHFGLGNALYCLGRPSEALAAYRRTIALEPKGAPAHYALGVTLHDQGFLDEAIAEVRQATILDGEPVGLAPFALGAYLRVAGRYDVAVATLRRLREQVKYHPERVKEVDRELALVARDVLLAPRLPAVLRGHDRAAGPAARLEF